MTRTLTIAILCGLAVQAAAEDLIHLTGGRFYRGEIVSSTPDSVTATVKNAEGMPETHTVSAEECDPYFFYGVRTKAIGDDAKARIELAKWCDDHDMFSRAKHEMDLAREADAAVVEQFMQNEFPKIKEGLAQKLLEAGQRALRRGSTTNAMKYAAFILTKFEGTKAEAGAEKLHDEAQAMVDAKEAKDRARRRTTAERKSAEEAKKVAEGRHKLLAPIEKLIDEGEEHNTKGLKAKGLSDSRTLLETAAKRFESAIRHADSALKQNPDNETKAAVTEARTVAVNGGISAYLNLAFLYSSRGNYNKATQYTNHALALDPDNAEAKSARAEIATSAGGWGRRGRR